MSVELVTWDEVKRCEINRLASRDAALGVLPLLILIEPSGDARIVSPLLAPATANLLDMAAQSLRRKRLQ